MKVLDLHRQRSKSLVAQINSGNLVAARTSMERETDDLNGGDGI